MSVCRRTDQLLAERSKTVIGDRVQRVGFYTVGSIVGTDPDATREVIQQIKG